MYVWKENILLTLFQLEFLETMWKIENSATNMKVRTIQENPVLE